MHKTLSIIAAAIFLSACARPEPPQFDPAPYLERGVAVTSAAFQVMAGQLQGKLQEGGVPAAIDYCSLAAYPLTDSLSAAYDVSIRRAALRYRNPANAPDSLEREVLLRFEASVRAGEQPKPEVTRLEDGSVAYHAPILLLEPCTRCHGIVGEQIAPGDYALISERYPDDQATGFRAGELRGIWSLRFGKE